MLIKGITYRNLEGGYIANKKGNRYIFEDNIVKIELRRRNGNKNLYTKISLEDYEKAKNYPYTWYAKYHNDSHSYYAVATVYFRDENNKPKNRMAYLERILLDVDGQTNLIVDHENHDTLDNTRNNLRIVTALHNTKNRSGKNLNNKSGYRNVFWNSGVGRWQVTLCKNYKRIDLGFYDDVDEAGRIAQEGRKEYYGEFAGKN